MRSQSDVFIVGPVRSGTSWLQTMLAEHPSLASPPETHLFARYLGPLDAAWHAEKQRLQRGRTQVEFGLSTVLTDDEFDAQLRSFYAAIRSLVLSAKPGASRLLEKTPDHAHWLDTIWRVVPDASIVCMVRDPRATVQSVLSARNTEWGDWAPTSVADATALWLASVRPIFAHQRDRRMTLVRYEDLRSDASEFDRVVKFLGLNPPSEWRQSDASLAPADRTSIIRRGAITGSPYAAKGFSFHDRRQLHRLSRYDQAYIANRCKNEMHALGYDTAVNAPFRLRVEKFIAAARFRARQLKARKTT
jgi:hypothetical protein